ncbi:MAG: glycosyltransferase family 2 protein [Kiritimatiellae bacterium]|nr:glycosyltransferase family 2 protein [Kiritimatiellia bacterium]
MNGRDAIPAAPPRYVAVIPAYAEEERIGPVVAAARAHGVHVLVVDDGSPDRTAEVARAAGAEVIRHPENRGKGQALQTGFRRAAELGCEAVITLDGDGQHDPAEIPRFIEAYERTRIPVLIGNRMWDCRGMPLVRRLTNRFMSWLLSREMRRYLPDTQCGYRLFRTDLLRFVETESDRFAAESEILLRLAARGLRMDSVRIRTIYRGERSKIRPLADTIRFCRMLRRWRRARAAPPA